MPCVPQCRSTLRMGCKRLFPLSPTAMRVITHTQNDDYPSLAPLLKLNCLRDGCTAMGINRCFAPHPDSHASSLPLGVLCVRQLSLSWFCCYFYPFLLLHLKKICSVLANLASFTARISTFSKADQITDLNVWCITRIVLNQLQPAEIMCVQK